MERKNPNKKPMVKLNLIIFNLESKLLWSRVAQWEHRFKRFTIQIMFKDNNPCSLVRVNSQFMIKIKWGMVVNRHIYSNLQDKENIHGLFQNQHNRIRNQFRFTQKQHRYKLKNMEVETTVEMPVVDIEYFL